MRLILRNKLFIESVLEISKADVFIDANKDPYRIKHLSKNFDTYAIYLYKNGIAGAYSLYNKSLKSVSPQTFEESCVKWFVEQITINRCIKNIKYINVAYSDLCNNTSQEVNKIFDLLSL